VRPNPRTLRIQAHPFLRLLFRTHADMPDRPYPSLLLWRYKVMTCIRDRSPTARDCLP